MDAALRWNKWLHKLELQSSWIVCTTIRRRSEIHVVAEFRDQPISSSLRSRWRDAASWRGFELIGAGV